MDEPGRSLTFRSDRVLDVNTMDTRAFSGQTIPLAILSKDFYDVCPSVPDRHLGCNRLHNILGYRLVGSLHLSVRPNLLFLGPYLQARRT